MDLEQFCADYLDVNHPSNQLKRSARRTCLHCSEVFRTKLAYHLSLYCSDECREEYHRVMSQLLDDDISEEFVTAYDDIFSDISGVEEED